MISSKPYYIPSLSFPTNEKHYHVREGEIPVLAQGLAGTRSPEIQSQHYSKGTRARRGIRVRGQVLACACVLPSGSLAEQASMHKEMEAKACHSALTQHVGGLNHVGVQVSPVQSLVGVINGEVVGPAHLVYQCHTIGPIHEGPHDPWLATPLGPVDIAGRGEGWA